MVESAPPKVMHVITGLEVGGAETSLANLVLSDHPVHARSVIVSLMAGGGLRPRIEGAGRRVVDLGLRRGRPGPGALLQLARLIRAERPAVVQGWMYHGDLAATLALRLSGRRRMTRLYWGIRCSDMEVAHYGWSLRLVIAALARLSPSAQAAIANSYAGRARHRAMGYRPPRFGVIANGVDAERFRPDPAARAALRAELGLDGETPVAVCVARVDPMKDHAGLLAAVARVQGLHLWLVGAGTEALPVAPRVRAFGLRQDVGRLLTGADLIVSSSAFGEGFSNALAEGMACGLVPVATDVGDASRIIGDTGWTVPPRSAEALTAGLAAALAEPPAARAARGLRARARVERHFSLAQATAAWAALYQADRLDEVA